VAGDGEITYRDTPDVDIFQLARLFEQAGWHDRTHDLGRLARVVQGSTFVATAWDDGRLVGFARAISDGVSDALLSTITVLEGYRRKGIGRELLRRILHGHDEIAFVLQAPAELASFCVGAGFERVRDVYRRTRRE
jgi:GNAT superfamily N-acetyltransferase